MCCGRIVQGLLELRTLNAGVFEHNGGVLAICPTSQHVLATRTVHVQNIEYGISEDTPIILTYLAIKMTSLQCEM